MQLIKHDINIDFMKAARIAAVISIGVVLASLVLVVKPGPRYGIDFSGGTEIQFTLEKPLEIGNLRALVERSGFSSTDLVRIGEGYKTYRIRLQAEVAFTEQQISKITKLLKKTFKDPGIESVKFSPGGEKIFINALGSLDTAKVEKLLADQKLDLR
jgi:preprotein translocase subunit SecF